MTENDEPTWPPTAFAEQLQSMSESATEQQLELFRQMMDASTGGGVPDVLRQGMGMGSAVFKTRVQSGGRISIPDTEREVLGIDEGDIVQAFIIPITRGGDNE
ncbi:MAG: AbrB/MazE/SpoVT family DNA-binding domain-containing protein [Halodesulfurarchaeum sp.]